VTSAADFVPPGAGLDALREAALGCRGCPLHEAATQTVFSKGPASARLVLVGEQPGDIEDRRGEPFVGPAGKLLDRALEAAGLDPADTYTTNAVKHFKFRMSDDGKRRIHVTPDGFDVGACRPWLVAEFAVLTPDLVVALGATAAKAMFGPAFRVTRSRGVLMPWPTSAATTRTTAREPRRTRWRPCTPRRCCAPTTGMSHSAAWSPTSNWQPARSSADAHSSEKAIKSPHPVKLLRPDA
jgi:uracil-DNA glycosylase